MDDRQSHAPHAAELTLLPIDPSSQAVSFSSLSPYSSVLLVPSAASVSLLPSWQRPAASHAPVWLSLPPLLLAVLLPLLLSLLLPLSVSGPRCDGGGSHKDADAATRKIEL